jgi:hypothetical protein
MTFHIRIESARELPVDKMDKLFSKIGNSVVCYMLKEGEVSGDLYFNFNINHIKNSYKKIKEGDPLINDDCSICLEKFIKGEYKRELTCGHTFHKRCIDKWTKNNNNCPKCRCNQTV